MTMCELRKRLRAAEKMAYGSPNLDQMAILAFGYLAKSLMDGREPAGSPELWLSVCERYANRIHSLRTERK